MTPGVADLRVRLLSKPGCHLCDDARAVVVQVCDDLGVGWEEIDVSTSPELWREHSERIPVVFVDGEEHDFWRVDAGRLRAELGG